MTQTKDQMRAEFEALIALEPPVSKERIAIALHKDQSGNYTNPHTRRDWGCWSLGWQAARASVPTGIMEDGQWNIEGANAGEIEAYEHGVRSTMSIVQRILDGDSDIGPMSSPMRDYRALMDEVRALKASAPQGVPEGWQLVPVRPTPGMLNASRWSGSGDVSVNEAWARKQVRYRMIAAAPQPIACGCEACAPLSLASMRMILCAKCGNKRCPHATDHRNACTDSNEPGQKGSSYEHAGINAAMSAQEGKK